MTTTERVIYSDFRTNFDIHPAKGDLVRQINAEAVKTSIRNILLTRPFERPRKPSFGAGLSAYLFEDISRATEGNIKEAIETAITNFEKRAHIIQVYVSALPDKNAYAATIVFSVINNIDPVKLDVLLERVR